MCPPRLLLSLVLLSAAARAGEWQDVSTPLVEKLVKERGKQAWPGGCSGVVVDRLSGAVTIKVVGFGLWRSSDAGKTWQQVDENTITGRDETGWSTSVDQSNPARIASFSLDGTAGWTADGKKWAKFRDLGRNWDYGSVDWTAPPPHTIIAAKHETDPPGEVYATADGGATWRQLSIHLRKDRDDPSMVGALSEKVFIYSNGDGIHRSTDAGGTWTKVSPVNPLTRIPVAFGGAHYLGTAEGLLVSRDLGATWTPHGVKVNAWQGPFFGGSSAEIMVAGRDGIFLSHDGAATWKKAADLKRGEKEFTFGTSWFGCYAWDPVHHCVYASAMANPVFRLDLAAAKE